MQKWCIILINAYYLYLGKIALANVVSDVYAVGVTEIDKISMILSIPTDLTDAERDVVVPLMVSGFKDAAKQAGCNVKINSMIVNPWCYLGGIASSICTSTEIIL